MVGAGWGPAGAAGSGPVAREVAGGAMWELWAEVASAVEVAGKVRWGVGVGAVQGVLIGVLMLRQM